MSEKREEKFVGFLVFFKGKNAETGEPSYLWGGTDGGWRQGGEGAPDESFEKGFTVKNSETGAKELWWVDKDGFGHIFKGVTI